MQAERLIEKRVDVLHIHNHDVERFWPLVNFMIAEALKYSGGYANAYHIKDYLIEGSMQLFVVFGSDDGVKQKVFGCLVTRITDQPNLRQLEGIILTGEKRELWRGIVTGKHGSYRDWETDRKSTRLNSSHSRASRMPSSA